jgi:hypothetical protein
MVCAILLTGPLFFYGVGTRLSLGALLALVSFADDWRSLPAKLRLTTHLLAARVPGYVPQARTAAAAPEKPAAPRSD